VGFRPRLPPGPRMMLWFGMKFARCVAIPLALAIASCQSEDPRLPQQLYDAAIQMNHQGRQLEAEALMEQLAAKYPDTPIGQQAGKDTYLMALLLRQAEQEREHVLRVGMKRVADALTRYKDKHGEYPRNLSSLVPDYLEQEPEAPWGHPFFFRPFVSSPILNTKDRKGRTVQVLNRKLDAYYLACLGVDLQPGGEGLAADTFIVNGEFYKEKSLPVMPLPQPVR